jgi:hypothetical protein
LRFQALSRPVASVLALVLAVLLAWPGGAQAAEVLQVRTATLLQIGDRNRNYAVELGCIAVEPGDQAAAIAWLRQELPRRTRVNLRPLGDHDGQLLAQVSRLDGNRDIGTGLIESGLAHGDTSSPDCTVLERS